MQVASLTELEDTASKHTYWYSVFSYLSALSSVIFLSLQCRRFVVAASSQHCNYDLSFSATYGGVSVTVSVC